ncbi:MAG TPA: NAD(P)-dependent oxidoreductase [Hyphomicrobiaceae bacterium]|nr:NAD(P)-dependent oxidoreductase [Hyphomicrobiaceae bacterium]
MRVVYWARMQLARKQVIAGLQAIPGVELVVVEEVADLLAALKGAEALILYDAPAAQARQVVEALAAPGNALRWMHFLTAGREGFEAAGLPSGVAVTTPAGCVAPTVAEHAMALLLALVRRVPDMLDHQSRRDWSRIGVSAKAMSVEGKSMAIVGYGQIGREVAQRAKAFGIRTIGISRTRKVDALLDECHPLDELDRVLARADVIMLTIALTAETHHLLDRRRLAACKPGVVLVNVARGGLVDQLALADALASGRVSAAGLDAVDPEPLPPDDPLWAAPNLIVSPHFAGGGSLPSLVRLAESATGNLTRLMQGEPLVNLVP